MASPLLRAAVLGSTSGLPRPDRLWLRLEADRIAGLSDGDAAATWSDLSGRGNHATQGTGSKQPLYKVGIFNGRPGVPFDGVDDFLSLTAALGAVLVTGDHSAFVVVKYVATGTDKRMLGASNGTGSNRFALTDVTATTFGSIYTTGAAAATLSVPSTWPPSTTTPQLFGITQASNVLTAFVDAIQRAQVTDAGVEAGSLAAALGSNAAGSANFANAYLAAVYVWDVPLTAAEVARLGAYARRYGTAS